MVSASLYKEEQVVGNPDFVDEVLSERMIKDILKAIPILLEIAGPDKRRAIYSVVSAVLAFAGVLSDLPRKIQEEIVDVVTNMIMKDPSKIHEIESFVSRIDFYNQFGFSPT